MTGNLKIDHRKYFKKITLTTAGGQFEGLQGVAYGFRKRPVIPLFVDYFVKSLHVHII